MSDIINKMVLRPRFDIRIHTDPESIKSAFDIKGTPPFMVKRIDEHVYIRFDTRETNFWTPQLHLEILSFSEGKSTIHGVFGPNPTLWTFFMFLHFGVGTSFLILSALAYSKYSLGHDITLYVGGMVLMVLTWFLLYAFGRLGKSKGRPQMMALRQYADRLFIDIQRKYAI